ncbi:MAG TPA: permease [Patescibacteria group bacterium]|nr:permease [Patescibacteria group bacterium]
MSIFQPLQLFADWVTYNLLSLEHGSKLADALNFFIYDSLKIILLLLVINYIMAMIRYYLPLEKIRDFLQKRKWYGLDYILAAMFGAITPFCSCSSIPLFVGFLGAGIPIGVTFTFLITSPLVNEAAIALFIGLFGLKLTIYYVLAAMTVGFVGGFVLSKINVKKHISPDILEMSKHVRTGMNGMVVQQSKKELMKVWWSEGLQLTKKLLPYVLIGIAIGAAIHGFVPQDFFEKTLNNGAWWTVPLATIVAVPLYSNAVGVIPIMQALVIKGVPVGTALAFMMATVGLSLPEALILKKVMSLKLLAMYFGVVTTGIILIGWVINFLF